MNERTNDRGTYQRTTKKRTFVWQNKKKIKKIKNEETNERTKKKEV